ncbi:DUF7511 domain-containing protein [Halalkalicoccus tibetensis]|uniref:DUF7511 domain-containing protein n=1 Tax=Halalkalicoccus tibetensis TaxID=175632 RepID=A0ABD5V148_9EURY
MRTSLSHGGGGSLRFITHEDGDPLDEWTLVPEDLDEGQRYTAWISADPSSVVDLDGHR